MDLDRHDEHKQHAFDSFCKKVIRCEAYNAYRAIGRRQDLEIPFSQLPEEAMETLATWDVYPWEYTSRCSIEQTDTFPSVWSHTAGAP